MRELIIPNKIETGSEPEIQKVEFGDGTVVMLFEASAERKIGDSPIHGDGPYIAVTNPDGTKMLQPGMSERLVSTAMMASAELAYYGATGEWFDETHSVK